MIACLYLPRAATTPLADAVHASSALVTLAQDFSPRVEVVTPELVLIDLSGLERLIGDADAVGAAICRLAQARTLPATVALAPTRTAAIILALADRRPGVPRARRTPYRLAASRVAAAAALALLPLAMLAALQDVETGGRGASPPAARTRAPARTKRQGRGSGRHYRLAPGPSASPSVDRHAMLGDLLQTLQRWGLTSLGDLTALPAGELFERLGAAGVAWQAVARGEDARPLVRTVFDEPFEETMTLEWPIETLEPLSFVLGRLLDPLCLRLERAERGAAALQTTLQLVTRTAHVRVLELPAPMREAKVLRTLILLDLESYPPDAGIDRVTVTIAPTPGRVVQHSLLARARPSPEQVATLTARLTAVLGEGRVGAPALVDSHEPGAFDLRRFDGEANAFAATPPLIEAVLPSSADGPPPASPIGFVLRRFRVPLAVGVACRTGRPVRLAAPNSMDASLSGTIVQAAGPWRTSGAWWTKVERPDTAATTGGSPPARPWDRDEWDVVVSDGRVLRLSCGRGGAGWVVEGVFD